MGERIINKINKSDTVSAIVISAIKNKLGKQDWEHWHESYKRGRKYKSRSLLLLIVPPNVKE